MVSRVSPPTLQPLLRSPWFHIDQCKLPKVVVIRRTDQRFEDMVTCERAHKLMLETVLPLAAPRGGVLLDVRGAVGRNDPAFEKVIARVGRELFSAFSRSAMIVKTEIGRLHVQRFHKESQAPPIGVFLSEEDAWAYLSEAG